MFARKTKRNSKFVVLVKNKIYEIWDKCMLKKIINNPRIILLYFLSRFEWHWIPDEIFLKIVYWGELGKKLNLKNPTTFNEKLNWKKIYDRKTIYTTMADKYSVKKYVSDRIGERYVTPLYGVWEKFEDIDFEKLPDSFVLKTTHDSGGVVLCKRKQNLDKQKIGTILNERLKKNYFWWRREWPYKNIVPRIIAEEYMVDSEHEYLPVYKIFCFHGTPRIIQCIQNDKTTHETIDYFDTKWNLLDLRQNFPNSQNPLKRPEKLDEMLSIASKLSEGFDFLRVDLYLINSEIKFSEFTFYTDAGINVFSPPKWDAELGEWLILGK